MPARLSSAVVIDAGHDDGQFRALSGYAFTGRDWDDETGLYYYRSRYFGTAVGVWLGDDPIGIFGGTNLSSYVAGAPTRFVDPLGLCSEEPGGASLAPKRVDRLATVYADLAKRHSETLLDRVGKRSQADTTRVLKSTALIGGSVATAAGLGLTAVAGPEAYLLASVAVDSVVPGTTLWATIHLPEIIQGVAYTPPSNFEQWAIGYIKAVHDTGSLWGNLIYRP